MPPTCLRLSAVKAYVKDRHGVDIVRETVYNWVKVGVNGEKLKIVPIPSQNPKGGPRSRAVTFSNWVDQFILAAEIK